jgi:hypothetical protein
MRDKLLVPIQQLEEALAAGVSGRERDWIGQLNEVLGRLEHSLGEHIAEADAPAGLFDILDLARQALIRQVNDLRHEHGVLLDQVRTLHLKVNRLARILPADTESSESAGSERKVPERGSIPEVATVRRQAEKFARVLKQHWEEEADLLIESVIRDIGGRLYSIA